MLLSSNVWIVYVNFFLCDFIGDVLFGQNRISMGSNGNIMMGKIIELSMGMFVECSSKWLSGKTTGGHGGFSSKP